MSLFTALALLAAGPESAAPVPEASAVPVPQVPKRIAKILAKRDGKSCETGYKVGSVRDEYLVMAALGLHPERQALVLGKKPCDMLTAADPQTGGKREVWFDISAFYQLF